MPKRKIENELSQSVENEKAVDPTKATQENTTPKTEGKKGLFSLFEKKQKENKKHTAVPVKITRFRADADVGLSSMQVEERISQGLVNKSGKKYSKSYRSIFLGNICTFFNLLCLIAGVALMLARAPLSQYLFVLIFLANIIFSRNFC